MSKEKNTSFKCPLCDNNVECVFDEEDLKSFLCYHCGTRYDVEPVVEEDEKEYYPFYNKDLECDSEAESHDSHIICPICGHHTLLLGNFKRSEVCGDVNEDEVDEYGCYLDDVIVDSLFCPPSGTSIPVIPCTPSEYNHLPYYNYEKKTEAVQ